LVTWIGPCEKQAEVVVPKGKIAAFARIDPDALEMDSVDDPGDGAYRKKAELAGAFVLRDLEAGEPIGEGDVLTDGSKPGPVHLEVQPEPAAALGLKPGKVVELLLTPTRAGGQPLIVTAILLAIPEAKDGAEQSYLVALTVPAREQLLGSLGRSRLLITAASPAG
jgi:hypothetical protein